LETRSFLFKKNTRLLLPCPPVMIFGDAADTSGSSCELGAMFGGVAVDTQKHAAAKLNVAASPQISDPKAS
jgi:hypothetical protein